MCFDFTEMAVRNNALLLMILVIAVSTTMFIISNSKTSNQGCNIRVNRNPSTGLLSKDGRIRECITLHIVRNVSIVSEWGIFDKSKVNTTTQENATQRQDSFSGIYKQHSWGQFDKADDARVSWLNPELGTGSYGHVTYYHQ